MNKPKVHFIGIGGIGTSALARWFLNSGHQVSGSDISSSEITNSLKKEGVKIFIGHRSRNLPESVDLVIHSAAIPKNNPELIKARESGAPVKLYSEALGELSKKYKTIAVSGAHGKSTTTALLSLVLIKAGFDRTVIIGTKLKEFGDNNFRNGKSRYLVLEADEYHKSFLNYSPFAAVITNIDREHLDYYKNLTVIKNVFLKFIKNVLPGGILILNKEDKKILSLKNKIKKITRENDLKAYWYGKNEKIKKIIQIPGEHNISNASAVYTLSKTLDIKDKIIFNALSKYRGAWRRMEHRGQLKIKNCKLKIDVYDDYAHHPTEIKATLSAFRQKYPRSKIICVFQPHQEERLKALFVDFIKSFDDADNLILLDIYKVKGREKVSQNNAKNAISKSPSLSKKLAISIKTHLKHAKNAKKRPFRGYLTPNGVFPINYSKSLVKDLKTTINSLITDSPKNGIIVMMGAGDIYKLTDDLIK